MSEPTIPITKPAHVMAQTSMAGDDWLSDRDRKAQARAEAARKKAAVECVHKLQAAVEAVSKFSLACLECNDASAPRRLDDSRALLMGHMREYATWLDQVYGSGR